MRLAALLVIAACGRSGFELRDDASVDAAVDALPDAAVTLVIGRVHCGTGPRTVEQICESQGFTKGFTAARAYHWFQCSGPGDCPTGWDGLSCADWCVGADCSSWQYCGAGRVITEREVMPQTLIQPGELTSCTGYNPGWRIRAYCLQ